jgi:hypothetical protein
MGKYADKCACIVDNGNFLETAITLAKDFGQVYYYSPWQEAYARSQRMSIGLGFEYEGVERTNSLWKIKDEVDLFVFPDVYHGDLQLELIDQGFRVWGSRDGDWLELQRDECKKLLKKLGLPVIPYEVITGIDALRKYIAGNKDVFVKKSVTRGDFESFGSKNKIYSESTLDEIAYRMGALKKTAEFIVEDAIEAAIELGYDGRNIRGQWPLSAYVGLEVKDKGYIGHHKPMTSMPKEITDFCKAISPTLEEEGYCNMLSTENRITKDHKSLMNDFCGRQGSPPSEGMLNGIKNWSDIMYEGADGKMVEDDCPEPWNVEVIIDSHEADKVCQSIQFPKELRENIKLRRACKIDGEYYILPNNDGDKACGAVVASGKTMKEAIKKCGEYCREVSGAGLIVHDYALDGAQDELEKLSKMGIEL